MNQFKGKYNRFILNKIHSNIDTFSSIKSNIYIYTIFISLKKSITKYMICQYSIAYNPVDFPL